MRITIIGGHGKVALLTEPLLLKEGHEVRAVIRNPEQSDDVAATGADVVVADVEKLSRSEIAELLGDSEAVIWSAGAGGGNPLRTMAVDEEAAIRTIDAAVDAGANRFVMVSYAGSGQDDVADDDPFRHYARAKAAADEHLRASALNWTILGPGALTNDRITRHIEAGRHVKGGATSRANVALVLSQVVGRGDLAGRTINFRDGHVTVWEALNHVAKYGDDGYAETHQAPPAPYEGPNIPEDLYRR